MLTIHSPKFSTGKTQITKYSPTFRHKRAPSVQDNYIIESHPKFTADSPNKLSEGPKRKSQVETHTSGFISKGVNKEKGTKQIIDSIQNLKEEYKILKDAYRDLIQQRLKNTHEISKMRAENSQLQQQNQKLLRQNERLRIQLCFMQQQNDRTRRECLKLLEVQKFKAQKLEESLVEKEQYINQTLLKIRTETDQTTVMYPRNSSLPHAPNQDVSLTISQDKSALIDRSFNNQSQFLSFSLTSVLEESTDKEQLTLSKRKHQHTKIASQLAHRAEDDEKKYKELPSFRKHKKEIPKLQLANIDSKTNINTNGLNSRMHADKKGSKGKGIKSFRQKENKETLNQNNKKKSKKLINLSGMTDL